MKLNRIYNLLMLAVLTGLGACDKDDDLYPQLGEDPRNISEIISETSNLSTFHQALIDVGMDSTLTHMTTYTVFAPNNEAFSEIDEADISDEEYENIILNHLVSTVTADFSHTMETGYITTMATGPNETNLSLFVNAESGISLNNNVGFVDGSYDIGSTNGVLHIINDILTTPTVPQHILANPEFSTLVEVLEITELSEILAATEVTDPENPEYPVTFFAPTNDAFDNLLSQLNGAYGWSSLEDIPEEILVEVLRYHMVTGDNLTAADVPGTEQTTVQGEVINIDANAVISDASYTTTNILTEDIQAINGVIHSIDKVLLPEDVFQGILDQTLNLKERLEDRGYSTFIQAADKVELDLENSEYTVFVPSNDAFETLLSRIENFESLDDFETAEELELLQSVLEYHLISGSLLSSQLTDGALSTVQGDELTVDTGAGSLSPSFEHAPNSNFTTTNIGATNGVIHEISNVLVSAEDAMALGYPVPQAGGPEFGFEIYHDALNADFWVGWTEPDFANTENVYSGDQSIRLDYAGWEAFQVGADAAVAPDLTQHTTLDFAIYSENGTEMLVAINGQDANGQIITVPADEWTEISIPLSEIASDQANLTQLVMQDQTGEAGTIYLDQIGLDVTGGGNAAPSFDLPVYTEGIQSGFNDTWDGWGGAWTWNSTEVVQNGETSIKAEYSADNWGALQIGGAADVNATDYTMFHFSAYGAPDSGTTPLLVNLGGSDDGVTVNVIEGEWTSYSIPISQFPDTSLGEIRFKNNSAEARTIYIDNIGFTN